MANRADRADGVVRMAVAEPESVAAAWSRPGGVAGERVQEVLALSRRWFLELRRDRLNLVFSVAQPAIWLVFFASGVERAIDAEAVGTTNYVAFMVPGVIAFTIVGGGVAAAMPLLFDKENGYLDRLLSMPVARSSVVVSRFVFQAALMSAQALIVLLVAALMGVPFAAGPGGVVVLLTAAALLTMAVTAAFLALAYRVRTHGTFFAITGFISLPLLFMSNAFVPVDVMPAWMGAVARLNPLTHAIAAMRTLVLEGWRGDLAVSLVILAAFAAGSLAVSATQFRRQTAERVG